MSGFHFSTVLADFWKVDTVNIISAFVCASFIQVSETDFQRK
jgi:hypothetical protein